jgi:HNH endonuclease/AP2 domain
MDNETAQLIKTYLGYDEHSPSGLRWIAPRKKVRVGDAAGFRMANGYWRVGIGLKSMLTHRVVFWLHNGFLPECVDHADGNPQNNKIENLRAASKLLNNHNQRIKPNNTSGVKGVYLHKASGKWMARIWNNYKRMYIGTYDTLQEAERAIVSKRNELHKEFANHG